MFTKDIYETLLKAYDFYNAKLFGNTLSPVLITLQRKRNSRGYFSPECFVTRTEDTAEIHEIALNPETFLDRTDKEIFSTLVHEMVHQWQREYGEKYPARAYHNSEWADKMVEVGLMPSSTGAEGGNRTGGKMTHYIIPGEEFDRLTDELLGSGVAMPLQAKLRLKAVAADKNKNKTPYVCPSCNSKIWGKPGVNARCGDCDELFVATNAEAN